jgi:hypothetical protein
MRYILPKKGFGHASAQRRAWPTQGQFLNGAIKMEHVTSRENPRRYRCVFDKGDASSARDMPVNQPKAAKPIVHLYENALLAFK